LSQPFLKKHRRRVKLGGVQQRLPSLLNPPIGFAHRGAKANAPENTLEAFRLALKLGAKALESDVWVTKDGVAVLDHDGVVKRGMRKVNISTLDRSELPAHIPTVEDLLADCGTDYDLSLDLKDPASGPLVIETVERIDPTMLRRVWLCHPDWKALVPLRARSQLIRLVDSTRLNRIKEGPERRAATLAENEIDAVNMHHTDWTGGLTTLFHRFGVLTFAWDLQHEHLLRNIVRMGADGVFSDYVDRMVDSITAETTG
jgi:glycerophosphoryl diester phosphodiesterase